MSAREAAAPLALVAAILFAPLAGCNSGLGDCPATASIEPGAACSDDKLQCPYDLPTVGPLCDGGSVETSCTCVGGKWECPTVSCGEGDATAGDGSSMSDGSSIGDAPAASDSPGKGNPKGDGSSTKDAHAKDAESSG